MDVVSLNVGRPRLVVHAGRSYSTAINKSPVNGPRWLGTEGFAGDKVADRRYHGGPEQAACIYAQEHYAAVAEYLGATLATPSFGENLTTRGLLEHEVAIGDTWSNSSATVQVFKPRQPCVKLARKHDRPELVPWIIEHLACGFYVRVLEEGQVPAGDSITLLERPHRDLTVAQCLRAMFHEDAEPPLRRAFAACQELSANWRKRLTA